MWADFSLHHAWFDSFVAGIGFCNHFVFSAAINGWLRLAIAAMGSAFLIALGVAAVVSKGITVEAPFVMKTVWFSMPGLVAVWEC